MNNIKEFIYSQNGRRVLYIIGAFLLSALIFHAGLVIGSHRNFRGNAGRNWGFKAPGFYVQFPRGFIQNGHGTVGTIQSVATSSVIIQKRDEAVQMIMITDKTTIRYQSKNASSTALAIGQQIVALGTPNDDGSMIASLIRVVPDDSFSRNSIKR
jgi:hypothetical protein